MLRRRPDNTFEFREVERMLYSIQPPPLAPERKDALRARIMDTLGEQEALRQAGILTPVFRERWVTVPAGVGIAAAIIGGIYLQRGLTDTTGDDHGEATFAGQLNLDGAPVNEIRPGPTFVAAMYTHVSLGGDVALMLEKGTSFRYEERDGEVTVYTGKGLATLATGDRPANVGGNGWSARLGAHSAATFGVQALALTVDVTHGVAFVEIGGESHPVHPGPTQTFSLGKPAKPEITPPADPFGGSGNGHPQPGAGAVDGHEDDDETEPVAGTAPPKATPVTPNTPPSAVPPAQGSDERPETPAEPQGPPAEVPAGPPDHIGEPPAEPEAPPEETTPEPPVTPPGPPVTPPGQGAEPPADPPGQGEPGEPGPPDDPGPPADPGPPDNPGPPENPGQQGNGQGSGNGPGPEGNGQGNGFGPTGNPGNGQGNGNGAGNGNGNQGNGNGNANQGVVLAVNGDPVDSVGESDAAPATDAGPGNGNGNAFGHDTAPGQAKSGVEPGNGNGTGSNNGNAANNPGKGKGPAHK